MRLLICFILFFHLSYSQNIRKIDSLKNALTKLTDPAQISDNMGKLSYQYGAINQDSALHYGLKAAEVAKKHKLDILLANAYIEIGNHVSNMISPDTSNYYFLEALKIYDKKNQPSVKLMILQNIGINYGRIGKLPIAIDYFFKALKMADKLNDSTATFMVKKNIGLAYFYSGKPDLALKYSMECYKYFKRHKLYMDLADCANNIGITYSEMDSIKKAVYYMEENIICRREVGDTIGLIVAMLNTGNNFMSLKDYKSAEKYYSEGYELAVKKKQIANMINLMLGLGNLKNHTKEYKEAIRYYTEAISLSEKDGYLYELKTGYYSLSQVYAEMNDYRMAYHYQDLNSQIKDSLYTKESSEAMLETEAKYQDEKKQLQIDNLNKEKKITEVEIKRQDTIKIGFGIGLVLCAIIAIVLLRGYRLKKKSADELQIKNAIIASQKQEVEEKQKDILDSIGYAKRLQEAILPPKSQWNKCLADSFVLYKPKDIVAGDFFWLEQKGDIVFVAAADCTGHGVPGAMVSVVCSNALNRAVKEFNLSDPGMILDKVRELVIETFEKSENEVKDGMDISLCVFDKKDEGKEKINVKWAGANNPLWYSENGNMIEVAEHKQPIGRTDNPVSFPSNTVEVKKGEVLFLFTDGYADQFGGPKGKKFKYKSLLTLLLNNIYKPTEVQKDALEAAFEDWKGSLEQVDDVTVIGIRF